jgi:hypothetical protein
LVDLGAGVVVCQPGTALHRAWDACDVDVVNKGSSAQSSNDTDSIAGTIGYSTREGSTENRAGVGGQQDNACITESSSSLELDDGGESTVSEVGVSRDENTGAVEGRDAADGARNGSGSGIPVVGDGAAESSLLGSAKGGSAVSRDDHAEVELQIY